MNTTGKKCLVQHANKIFGSGLALSCCYVCLMTYNRDWSIVHLQTKLGLPHAVLYPSKPQALHIGADGMHGKHVKGSKLKRIQQTTVPPPFDGNTGISNEWLLTNLKPKRHERGYGGWGHPADQNHCVQIFQPGSASSSDVSMSNIVVSSPLESAVSSSERLLAKWNPFRWFQ